MNNDRHDNGEQTMPLPPTGDRKPLREGSPTVDDQGIPILNEVIYPETDLSDDSALIGPESSQGHGLHLPDPEALLAAMRVQLQDRLTGELDGIVDRVAATTAKRLEEALRRELREMLDRHLRRLLDALGSDDSPDKR